MLSHVSCFRVARQVEGARRLSHAAFGRRKGPKDREIVLDTVIDQSGLRYSVLHVLRAKGSWRRFACPLLLMSQRRFSSPSITLSEEVLFLTPVAVFGPNADWHRRELAFSGLVIAEDGVPRAS